MVDREDRSESFPSTLLPSPPDKIPPSASCTPYSMAHCLQSDLQSGPHAKHEAAHRPTALSSCSHADSPADFLSLCPSNMLSDLHLHGQSECSTIPRTEDAFLTSYCLPTQNGPRSATTIRHQDPPPRSAPSPQLSEGPPKAALPQTSAPPAPPDPARHTPARAAPGHDVPRAPPLRLPPVRPHPLQ